MRRQFFLACAILLVSNSSASGQESIRGKVVYAGTGEALAGVHVIGYGKKIVGNSSNAEGDFVLQQRSELDSIRISAIGYTTVVLLPEEFLRKPFIISLHPFVTSLQALTVTAPTPQQLIRQAVQAEDWTARDARIRFIPGKSTQLGTVVFDFESEGGFFQIAYDKYARGACPGCAFPPPWQIHPLTKRIRSLPWCFLPTSD